MTSPYREVAGATIVNANSLDYIKSLPANSIDSIVTDPPYEIGFMGRGWDSTGIAYNVELWKECLRVLKPGGHALVFGATRTYHRVAVAIEDAGFEIRDSIHWVYGQGFPKSMDISKAIDKQAGVERTEVIGERRFGTTSTGQGSGWNANAVAATGRQDVTAPATDAAKQWEGWGTALKPAHEPIVVARKPLDGTVASNVLTHGVGGLNIDASRVGTEVRTYDLTMTSGNFETTGGGANRKQGEKTVEGRFPTNFLLTHSSECVETGEIISDKMTGGFGNGKIGMSDVGQGFDGADGVEWQSRTTETSVFQCVPGCPVAEMDQQSGVLSQGHWAKTKVTGFGEFGEGSAEYQGPGEKATDKGGASRFFPAFQYEGKAGKKERPIHPETGKGHPTVKPLELMRWLVRLVTPVGGTMLEPFAGSGATVEAALLEGAKVIAIDLEADHMPLIDVRIDRFLRGESPVKKAKTAKKPKPTKAPTLFDPIEEGE